MSTITKRMKPIVRIGKCRCCGCTAMDCSQCVERTGDSCRWVNPQQDLCSACICDKCGVDAAGRVEFIHPLMVDRFKVPVSTPAIYSDDILQWCAKCRKEMKNRFKLASPDRLLVEQAVDQKGGAS